MNIAAMCIRGCKTRDPLVRRRITDQTHYLCSRRLGHSPVASRLRVHLFRANAKFRAWLFVVLT